MRAENRKLILLIAAVLAVLAGLLLFEHRGAQTPAPPSGTPLPTAAPTPAVTAARGKLRVEELMLKNAAVLPDEDGDFSDSHGLDDRRPRGPRGLGPPRRSAPRRRKAAALCLRQGPQRRRGAYGFLPLGARHRLSL